MEAKKRQYKSFRLENKHINMLERLVAYENAKLTNKKDNIKINERKIVEKAIENLYYQTFTDGAIQSIMPMVWSEIVNKTSLIVEPLVLRFAQVMNLVTLTEDTNREMIAVLLRQSGFDIEPLYRKNNIYNLTVEDEIIFKTFRAAIEKKREQTCSQGENDG